MSHIPRLSGGLHRGGGSAWASSARHCKRACMRVWDRMIMCGLVLRACAQLLSPGVVSFGLMRF